MRRACMTHRTRNDRRSGVHAQLHASAVDRHSACRAWLRVLYVCERLSDALLVQLSCESPPRTTFTNIINANTAALTSAGYHRLFAHRCYTASTPLRVWWMLLGAGAFEGSVRWWSRDHRAHHRYVDTDKDPYAIIKGFWYAHVGWMLVKQDKTKIGKADISGAPGLWEFFQPSQHRQSMPFLQSADEYSHAPR